MSKHLKALFIMACLFAIPFLSCNTPVAEPNDDGNDNTGGEIITPEDSNYTRMIVNPVDFDLEAGDTTVKVRISSTAEWTIDNPSDWCELSADNGAAGDATLKITVSANYTGKSRSTSLVIASVEDKPVTKKISISQGCYYDVTASTNRFEATWEGGEFTTEIVSDKEWEVVGAPDWITVKPSKGPKGTCDLQLSVEPYNQFGERSAEMVFKGNFDTTDTLWVHQTGRLIFETTSPLTYDIVERGDTLSFDIRSNVLFTAEYSDSWLRCDLTEGMPDDEVQNYTLVITKNYNNKRQGNITLTAAEGDSTIVFTFDQAGSREIAAGNELTEFRFTKASNPTLTKDITLTISGDSIIGYIPEVSVDISALAASFRLNSNYAKVYVNNVRQVSGKTKVDFSTPCTYTVVAENGKEKIYTVALKYFTGIPILYLNTDNGYEISSNQKWESAKVRIYGGLENTSHTAAAATVKGINDNTWATDAKKRSFEFTLTNADELLGMPSGRKWALMSNYSDKTMLRTMVGLEIGRATGLAWTPTCTPVELIMNGTYRGTYLLCEQIDGTKLGLGKDGFLLKAERTENPLLHTFASKYITGSLFAATDYSPIQIVYPLGNASLNSTIEKQFSAAEEAICNSAGNWENISANLDINSFARQWLVYENAGTPEPKRGPFNLYLYKKTNDDKFYGGPVWSFNYQSFIPATQAQWENSSAGWIPYLWNNDNFRKSVKTIWDAAKSRYHTIASTYISEQAKFLEKSAEANWTLHEPNLSDDNRSENGDEKLSSAQAVSRMQTTLKARLDWLDKQFADWGTGTNNSGADATIDRVESDNSDKNKENFWN
jgi:hypothetical protein